MSDSPKTSALVRQAGLRLGNEIARREEIILYGAGRVGLECLNYLDEHGLSGRVAGFVDSDAEKWGQSLGGKKIESPDSLRDNQRATVIISIYGGLCSDRLFDRVKNLGISEDRIFSNILLFDEYWGRAPGILDTPPFGAQPFNRAGLFPALLSEPLITVPPQRILDCYDSSDQYTESVIRFLCEFVSPDRGRGLISFQPYAVCRSFCETFQTNKMHWSEVLAFIPESELTICDFGAHIGDSLGAFGLVFSDEIATIYAFEPDAHSYGWCRSAANFSKWKDRITCFNFACGEKNETAKVHDMRLNAAHGQATEVRRFDDLKLPVVGKLCFKMDVEGYEMAILKGAAEAIKRHRPHLAVCVYHHLSDLWRIPEYLKSLVPDYRFVLRGGAVLVCYGFAQGPGPVHLPEDAK